MNQSTAPVKGIQETSEVLSVMVLFLPDQFPPTVGNTSLEYWFGRLNQGLETIDRIAAKREGGSELLLHMKSLSLKSENLYRSSTTHEIEEGRVLLQETKVGLGDIARAVRTGKDARVVSTWHQYTRVGA